MLGKRARGGSLGQLGPSLKMEAPAQNKGPGSNLGLRGTNRLAAFGMVSERNSEGKRHSVKRKGYNTIFLTL